MACWKFSEELGMPENWGACALLPWRGRAAPGLKRPALSRTIGARRLHAAALPRG